MNAAGKRLVPVVFLALVLAFFGLYLGSIDYEQLSTLELNLPLLLLATLVALLSRYWGVYIWRTILTALGSQSLPSFSILGSVYSKAWMGRYVPGKVTWIAGKIYFASAFGISRSRLAVSALLEGGMQIVALLAVSMLLLGLDARLGAISDAPRLALVGAAALCLLILHPRIFNALARKVHILVKKQEPGPELRINGKAVFKSFGLYSLGAVLSGTSFLLLVMAVDPDISSSLYLFCIGAHNLSGAMGMATPLLPSGIGVRDGVLLVLLTMVLPADIAAALTILSRLFSAVVDVLFYFSSALKLRVRDTSMS